jgi:hypothetical protein
VIKIRDIDMLLLGYGKPFWRPSGEEGEMSVSGETKGLKDEPGSKRR